MKKLVVAGGLCAAFLCGLAATPAAAVTTVITITSASCATACGNGSALLQTLGDSALADVSHRSTTLAGVTYESALKFWGTGYGDLAAVSWGGSDPANYRGEWTFTPAAGYEISLIGFDAGCYQNRSSCQLVNYQVADLSGAALGGGSLATNYPGHVAVAVNSAYVANGIVLTWGPDAYDTGINNIAFDVRAIGTGGPVPEPASWALMILGFGVIGSALRRRSTAIAFA